MKTEEEVGGQYQRVDMPGLPRDTKGGSLPADGKKKLRQLVARSSVVPQQHYGLR